MDDWIFALDLEKNATLDFTDDLPAKEEFRLEKIQSFLSIQFWFSSVCMKHVFPSVFDSPSNWKRFLCVFDLLWDLFCI